VPKFYLAGFRDATVEGFTGNLIWINMGSQIWLPPLGQASQTPLPPVVLHDTYPRAENIEGDFGMVTLKNIYIYKMFENTIWFRGSAETPYTGKDHGLPVKFTATLNIDNEVTDESMQLIHPNFIEYRIWGTTDYAMMSALG
jgi:hypothetical protein